MKKKKKEIRYIEKRSMLRGRYKNRQIHNRYKFKLQLSLINCRYKIRIEIEFNSIKVMNEIRIL